MIILTGQNNTQAVLPDAQWGDSYSIHLGLQVKRSMSGKPFCNIKTPFRKVYKFSVAHMNVAKRQELENFVRVTAGSDIIIIFDYAEFKEAILPPKRVKARLIGDFKSNHSAVRNNLTDLEYEELPSPV